LALTLIGPYELGDLCEQRYLQPHLLFGLAFFALQLHRPGLRGRHGLVTDFFKPIIATKADERD
jgi:hypothetical protein